MDAPTETTYEVFFDTAEDAAAGRRALEAAGFQIRPNLDEDDSNLVRASIEGTADETSDVIDQAVSGLNCKHLIYWGSARVQAFSMPSCSSCGRTRGHEDRGWQPLRHEGEEKVVVSILCPECLERAERD
jgi:hypothetical protein